MFRDSQGQGWVYVFGGFDKKPIDDIERIKLTFGRQGKHQVVTTKWERLKDATLLRSVECCGVTQFSDNEIVIFGGLQKGAADEETTQLLVFNTESHSFAGTSSYLKYADYFQLPPYRHKPAQGRDEEQKEGEAPADELYAWSIYDGLHIMEMKSFTWSVFEPGVAQTEMQPQSMHS